MAWDAGDINDWYLNRQGGSDARSGDDEQPARNPDIWLDRVTGPAARRGQRAVAPPSGDDPRRASSGRRERQQRPRSGWTRWTSGRRALVSEIMRIQVSTSPRPSHKEVARRLNQAGWQVSASDVQRAMRDAFPPWGRPSRQDRNQWFKTAAAASFENSSPRSPQALAPAALSELRRVRAARPDFSIEEIARNLRNNGFQVSHGRIVDAIREMQFAHGGRGRPTTGDQALAREASLVSAQAVRRLSLDEILKELRTRGWTQMGLLHE